MLRLVKEKLDMKFAGVYCVPRECWKVYVGQRSWRDVRNIWGTFTWVSQTSYAMAEHNVSILDRDTWYMDHCRDHASAQRVYQRWRLESQSALVPCNIIKQYKVIRFKETRSRQQLLNSNGLCGSRLVSTTAYVLVYIATVIKKLLTQRTTQAYYIHYIN
jgi:hypothetical protein